MEKQNLEKILTQSLDTKINLTPPIIIAPYENKRKCITVSTVVLTISIACLVGFTIFLTVKGINIYSNEIYSNVPDNENATEDTIDGTITTTSTTTTTAAINISYYIQSRLNGMVIDLLPTRDNHGAFIVINPLRNDTRFNSARQLWYFDKDGTVRNKATGMVITIWGGIYGTMLIAWPKVSDISQLWTMNGAYLTSPINSKVADIAFSRRESEAFVICWMQTNGVNQQWDLIPNGS